MTFPWILTCLLLLLPSLRILAAEKPNVIVIFADDLGYGDLGCYGHPTIRTPHLDRMAAEGLKFTEFYSAAPVCTPSRAALLTGRLPIRNGMCSDRRVVLFPNSASGMQDGEITIAEKLKEQGYRTGIIGKWHLGHLPQFLPARQGFDFYFGIPYSNDMNPKDLPLLKNEEVVERPAVQETLTKRYTAEAIRFIKESKNNPFFLYMPHTFPHVPLFASEAFKGKSPRGLYGDVVEEMDWSVGEILNVLKQENLARKTLVLFTSDNGPWLIQKLAGGSAGLLRDGKGSTWEGGMRVPGIAWWPGTISPARVTDSMASTMDIFPTVAELVGFDMPKDRPMDGVSMVSLLKGSGAGSRQEYFYYRGEQLYAIRKGNWKIHLVTQPGYGPEGPKKHDPPLLFNLKLDPSEQYDVAEKNPAIVSELKALSDAHQSSVTRIKSHLDPVTETPKK